jgi:hypothetical protein
MPYTLELRNGDKHTVYDPQDFESIMDEENYLESLENEHPVQFDIDKDIDAICHMKSGGKLRLALGVVRHTEEDD